MEVDDIQTQHSKFSRLGNGRTERSKIGQYPDENQSKELKRSNLGAGSGANLVGGVDSNRLRGWHNSSRIIRVSRASGGKDRHSKVWTSKGLRDRRVRLSVTTAIQFYDLQDRLGYDQPSKAVEWLIKAAADAINELPSLDGSFPETPRQLSDDKRVSDGVDQGFDSADVELEDHDQDPNFDPNPTQHFSLSKSACSSTSDTSKGSGLSLSRSDARVNRVKARERARERTAKEKEKECNGNQSNHQNPNPISQNSSFTELLTGGIGNVNSNSNHHHHHQNAAPARQWPLTPMEYFNSTGFPGQIHSIPPGMAMSMSMSINPPFNFSGENNQPEQMQHFPFLSDHLIPVGATSQGPNGDYNLNFTISSGIAGFNRGTLQSNSPSPNSLFPHLQRFQSSSPLDTSSTVPFFMENHSHQFPPGLHLYGDGSSKHSDHKGKGKN